MELTRIKGYEVTIIAKKQIAIRIRQLLNTRYYYIDDLRSDLSSLKRDSKLYKLLKQELSMQGYWHNKPRGDAAKGYRAMKQAMSIKE